ncbi:hypothetical protein [Domibacillus antri]|nr:hypothetical protein [Domibacillus antri]
MLGILVLLLLCTVEVLAADAALKASGEEVDMEPFDEFFDREYK